MGRSAKVVVFYGIDYGPEEDGGDAARFRGDDATPEGDRGPAGLAYYGAAPDSRVEAVRYGHPGYRRHALAARFISHTGRGWEPLDLSEAVLDPHVGPADDALRDYCERYGLTYRQPRWIAVPVYG